MRRLLTSFLLGAGTFMVIPVFSQGVMPAGVGQVGQLSFWLRAEDLDLVDQERVEVWPDASGNLNHAYQLEPQQQPIFLAGTELNGQPMVRFDGVDDAQSGDFLTIQNNDGLDGMEAFTLVMVIRPFDLNWNEPVLCKRGATNDPETNAYSVFFSTGKRLYVDINTDDNRFLAAPVFDQAVPHIITLRYNGKEDESVRVQVFLDGALVRVAPETATSVLKSSSDLLLGTFSEGSDFFAKMDLGEMMLFSVAVNDAERIILENYLSAKYDIPLGANNVYLHDGANNGNFDFGVTGLGRVDVDQAHLEAFGTGQVGFSNATDLGNMEFFMVGHNNQSENARNTSDVHTPDMDYRLNRTWRISESGEVGGLDVLVDLSALDSVDARQVVLLVDLNSNGRFADDPYFTGCISLGQGVYTFKRVGVLNNNLRFSFGIMKPNAVPPAMQVAYGLQESASGIQLHWTANVEINNQFYSLERSLDSLNWASLATISARDNGSFNTEYSFTDVAPAEGLNFYRLSRTDALGASEVIGVLKFVKAGVPVSLSPGMYPNPAQGQLNIVLEDGNPVSLQVCEPGGKMLALSWEQQGVVVKADVSELPEGYYWVRMVRNDKVTSSPLMIKRH